MAGVPEAGPLGVDPRSGRPLSHAQAGMLVGAEKASEFEVVVPRQAHEPALEVAPQHGHAADSTG